MKEKVTMQMIADALGITKVSVSKALNNRPDISDELRERVLSTARTMGYVRQPRAGSRGIRHLGFIEPKRFFMDSGDFFTKVYYHLLQLCSSHKIHLHLHIVSEEEENELTLPFPFEQNLLDGIFLGGEFPEPYLGAIKEYGIPTIAIGFYEAHNDIDSVIVDDYHNGYQIAKALVDKGYESIGFVGDTNVTHGALDRYHGYLKALKESDIELREEWVISDCDAHGQVINDFQLPANLPRGFMCHSDFAAYHLAQKLNARNLQVPRDVAITSFDITQKAKDSGCEIGIDVTGAKFAEAALERMLWRQMNPNQDCQRIIINAPLVFL